MNNIFYAHVHKETMRQEPLFEGEESHLRLTGKRAATFAAAMIPQENSELAFFAGEAGRLLGYWHDLGKCSREFQKMLREANDAHALEKKGRVDHSTAGAQHAEQTICGLGTLLAFAIAGHHAGLPDWYGTSEGVLKNRLKKPVKEWLTWAPKDCLTARDLPTSIPLPANGFACAFFVRMLFSCLTDADFLATEKFMDADRTARREAVFPTMAVLAGHLRQHLSDRFSVAETAVQRHRQGILQDCWGAAGQAAGFFSLNVPTGGGKTLSALAFALDHAAANGLRRVICAIPFTSIIEQNTQVYRDVFASLGDGIVLEHHTNLDPDDPQVMSSRLAAENWDAPIIVTTNVQFFESLFANRPGRCRKLHRIARSVIILDEAQALPARLMKPCLYALKELVNHYGCTVVLSTATQPALEKRENFSIGLTGVREIIPDPVKLHAELKRVTVKDAGVLSLEGTAQRLVEARQGQGMVIVNSRRHAQALYHEVKGATGGEGCFHLSALMCPRHRTEQLAKIRERLKNRHSCRVVATQLVEAGVDLDFPLVYRARAGLDAVAQAAGRCNREGEIPHPGGQTWVFTPAEASFLPKRDLGQAAGHANEVMALPQYQDDFLSLAAMEHYFRLHYWNRGGETGKGWDEDDVVGCFELGNSKEPFPFRFKQAAADFQLIEELQKPVIIPWDDKAWEEINRLRAVTHPAPGLLSRAARVLQGYVVTLPPWEITALEQAMAVETLHERFRVLLHEKVHYSQETGLIVPKSNYCDPASLIVDR